MKFSTVLAWAYSISVTSALPQGRHRSTKFSRMVVFGDSFGDNGNGAWIASNGTWPADPAYYGHSFSNGPKWNEVASKALGLELVNLATGGATSDNMFVQGGTGPDSTILVPSTQDQIQRFLSEDEPRDDDVFVHWIGANDVLFNNTVTGAQITAVIKTQIDELRDAGAKTVIMANYNDMDTFPGTYKIPYYDTPNVRAYTRDMTANLQKLAYEYSSDDDDNDDDDCFTLSLIDVAALIRNITARPAEYNIDAKYVNPPTGCLTGVYKSEGVPRNLCKDPERHLWFDAYHLVKGVHELIGTLFETRIREIAHK